MALRARAEARVDGEIEPKDIDAQ